MDTIIAEQQFEAEAAAKYEARGIKIETPLTDKLGIHQEFERAKQVYFRNNPDAVCRLLFEVVPGVNS